MKSFTLKLYARRESKVIEEVVSFVGRDSSGSFGILAGHERMMTSLSLGLASFRLAGGKVCYLALPGALLTFCQETLTINTERYLIDEDYMEIQQALQKQIVEEEKKQQSVKLSLIRLEEEMLNLLWEAGR